MTKKRPKEAETIAQGALDASEAKEKHAGGRPSLYRHEYAELARKYCLLGATDAKLAQFFDVEESTINNWKIAHPEFMESIASGKDQADAEVANRLFQRAMGFTHPEIDIRVVNGAIVETPITKIYPPDPTSAIFWLKNRQKQQWRDKVDHEHTGADGGAIQHGITVSFVTKDGEN